MSVGPRPIVPHSIDLSTLVRRSVASLYSNLVTRPLGEALRMGIESQIAELGEFCVSILDFTQVVVLDYSCADEAVAKLVLRYQRPDRPSNAYFIARGVGEQHRDAIEAVLARHDLALVADLDDEGYTLLGAGTDLEHRAWLVLQQRGQATPADFTAALALDEPGVCRTLDALVHRRAAVRTENPLRYTALTALLNE